MLKLKKTNLLSRSGREKRNQKIVTMYTNPPYPAMWKIGNIFNISTQGAQQILKKKGIKASYVRKKKQKEKRNEEKNHIQNLIDNIEKTEEKIYDLYINQNLFFLEIAEQLKVKNGDFEIKIAPLLSFLVIKGVPKNSARTKLEKLLIFEAKQQGLSIKEYLNKIYIEKKITLNELVERYNQHNHINLCRILRDYNVMKKPNKAPRNYCLEKIMNFALERNYQDIEKFLRDYSIVPVLQLARVFGITTISLNYHKRIYNIGQKNHTPRCYDDNPWFTDEEVINCSLIRLERIREKHISQNKSPRKNINTIQQASRA